MDFYKPFNDAKDKLDEMLTEYNLVSTWRKLDYPLKLIISPDQSPEAQMTLLSDDTRPISSKARICYTFELDETDVTIEGKISLPDSVMNSIKNHAKKLYELYTKGFFAAVQEGKEAEADEPNEADALGENKEFDGFYSDEPDPPETDGQ